jgi:hypothetical protein
MKGINRPHKYSKSCLLLPIGVCFFLFACCAGKPVQQCSWQQPQIETDGLSEEWTNSLKVDSKSGMVYGISNNETHLNILLKISNEAIQQKIMMTGLTCWIDPCAKEHKTFGIVFPEKEAHPGNMRHDPPQMMGNQSGQNQFKPQLQHLNKRFLDGHAKMTLKGFSEDGEDQLVFNLNPSGVNGMIQIDSAGLMIYEVSIPLSMILENPQQYLTDSTMVFSLGFETGALEGMNDRFGDNQGMRGGGPPGAGGQPGGGNHGSMTGSGMPGGGMPGGGQPGGGGQMGGGQRGGGPPGGDPSMNDEGMRRMKTLSEPTKFWIKKVCLHSVPQ